SSGILGRWRNAVGGTARPVGRITHGPSCQSDWHRVDCGRGIRDGVLGRWHGDPASALGRAGAFLGFQRSELGPSVPRLWRRSSRMKESTDTCEGMEVPLHRSLASPMLIAGLPRTVCLVLWTTTLGFAFGLRQIWMLPLGSLVHVLFAALTKA